MHFDQHLHHCGSRSVPVQCASCVLFSSGGCACPFLTERPKLPPLPVVVPFRQNEGVLLIVGARESHEAGKGVIQEHSLGFRGKG